MWPAVACCDLLHVACCDLLHVAWSDLLHVAWSDLLHVACCDLLWHSALVSPEGPPHPVRQARSPKDLHTHVFLPGSPARLAFTEGRPSLFKIDGFENEFNNLLLRKRYTFTVKRDVQLLPVSHLGTGPISDRTKCIHFCVGFVKKGSSSPIPILKHSILKIKHSILKIKHSILKIKHSILKIKHDKRLHLICFYSAICAGSWKNHST